MTPRAWKIWLACSVVVSLVVAPFLARGDQSLKQLKQHNAAEIAKMSVTQRARLQQNEQLYKAMTPAERASVESLHASLEKDLRIGGGELTNVMEKYDAWLKTIEPYQREQLANTRDPQARIALMQEIVCRQREKVARRNMPFSGSGAHWFSMPVLDEKSLASVMQAIEKAADDHLSDEQKKELQRLQGLKRDFRLLQILKEFGTGLHPKPLLESPPREFAEVAEKIDQYVDDPRILEFIRGKNSNQKHASQWNVPTDQRLTWLLSHSLLAELFKLRKAVAQQPDVEKLEAFLATLPPDQEYELLELEASDFQTDLRNQYLDAEGLNGLPGIHDFRKLFGRPHMRGGPGQRRPGRPHRPDQWSPGFGSRHEGRGLREQPSEQQNSKKRQPDDN